MRNLQHNLVSILYTVKGMAESHGVRAREGRFRSEAERRRHAEAALETVRDQAERAIRITKQMSSTCASVPETGAARRRNSVRFAWRAALARLGGEFALEGLIVTEHIPKDFPPVLCQRDEFREILYTLARNALEAMGREGRLVIRCQIGFSVKEEPLAVIMIADTGPGISQKTLTHLFHPFFTTKPEGRGSGLGLYFARELVRKNGGRIAVSSFQDCGTTVTLELPLDLARLAESPLK